MPGSSDSIVCPSCGKSYAYKLALAGKRVKCKCGGVIKVAPAAAAVIEETEAPPPGFEDMDFGAGAVDMPAATPAPLAPRRDRTAPLARETGSPGKKSKDWKWWQYAGGAVLIAGLAVFEFIRLGALESGEVESVRVAHWEGFLYNLLGRAGLLIVMLLVAIFVAGVGIYQFLQDRKARA